MPGTNAERTYLYVPPEEKAEVEALGAHWDDKSKCWYIGSDENAARFSKWLPDGTADEEFTITSERAYVASTGSRAQQLTRLIGFAAGRGN
jgi:hypothetical protein